MSIFHMFSSHHFLRPTDAHTRTHTHTCCCATCQAAKAPRGPVSEMAWLQATEPPVPGGASAGKELLSDAQGRRAAHCCSIQVGWLLAGGEFWRTSLEPLFFVYTKSGFDRHAQHMVVDLVLAAVSGHRITSECLFSFLMCSLKHIFFPLSLQGMIVDIQELVCAESLSQRYCFLSRLASRWPQLAIVCHDDACHLKLFALQHRRSTAIAERMATMDFIVDRFHAPGHCGEYCAQHCLPTIEENKGLLGTFPTEIAEIVNSEMTPLGHTIHHMGKFFAQLVVSECTDVHNLSRLLALRDKQRADAKKRRRGTIQLCSAFFFSNFSRTPSRIHSQVNGTANYMRERESCAFLQHVTSLANDFHAILLSYRCFRTPRRATCLDRMMRHLQHCCRGHIVFVFRCKSKIHRCGIESLSNREKSYFTSHGYIYIYTSIPHPIIYQYK